MSRIGTHPPLQNPLIEQQVLAELGAVERKELRSQEQIEGVARLLRDAPIDLFIEGNKLGIMTAAYGAPLEELPVLMIDVISRPDGLRDFHYYKTLAGDREWTQEELNPTSRNSRMFLRDFEVELLAKVKDGKVITPTLSTLKAIKDEYLADQLELLISGGKRITYVHGVPATWDHEVDQRAWSTNADTVYFIDRLIAVGAFHESVRTAAEIGCGIGGISQATILRCPNLEHFVYTDIDPNAINATRRNIAPLLQNVSSNWFLGKGLAGIIPTGTLDLIVCNPPYLPDPNQDGDKDHYSGTKLIERIFYEGMQLLNKNNPQAAAYIQASNLTGKDLELLKKKYPNVEVTPIGKEFRVPLRNFHILNDDAMINYLLENHGLEDASKVATTEGISSNNEMQNKSCRYFHKIIAYKLRPI